MSAAGDGVGRVTSAFWLLLALSPACTGDLTLERADDRFWPPRVDWDGGGLGPDASLAPPRADAGPPTSDDCGDLRRVSAVHYGTSAPTYLPMTQGQIYAVGSFNGCSGLVVGPTWVLSARHCMFSRGSRFCVDRQARDPAICFSIVNVFHEPGGNDMTLLELDGDVTEQFPEVEPVLLMPEDLDASWVGRTAESGGYGQQEDGGFNERQFTADEIVELDGDRIVVDGGGRHGVCYGDSGGPIMVLASDGSVRTAGVVSDGDGSCTRIATFTRVDLYRSWLETHLGPTRPPGPQPCGDVTSEGACVDGAAHYCGADGLVMDRCETCGWEAGAGGFRCLSGPDPCGGLSPRGRCDGEVARWCERGQERRRDCGACAQRCAIEAGSGAGCE